MHGGTFNELGEGALGGGVIGCLAAGGGAAWPEPPAR